MTYIRILTGIQKSSLREATGNISDVDPDPESKASPTANESFIGNLRILAFYHGSNGDIVYNKLYHSPSSTGNSDTRFTLSPTDPNQILLDFHLKPGVYDIILIANMSNDVTNTPIDFASIQRKSDLQDIEVQYNVTTPTILATNIRDKKIGLTMVGEATIEVPKMTTTPNTPHIITSPIIPLKRTVSKIIFTLTNLDTDGNVYQSASDLQVINAGLKNAYSIAPLMDEIALKLNGRTPQQLPKINVDSPNIPMSTPGQKLPKTIIFTQYISCPLLSQGEHTEVTVDVQDFTNNKKVTYDVPLYQLKPDQTKSYTIYRNTTYTINAILTGKRVKIELPIVAIFWEPYNQGTVIIDDTTDTI